ncbi:MAG: AAA family ATPase [Pseudomonadales bacterium]|nr:AAA family ATPase [Pseudomonadales bacterium]
MSQYDSKQRKLVNLLTTTPPEKDIVPVTLKQIRAVEALVGDMPNFKEPIMAIADALLESYVAKGCVEFPNILVIGPPGIGKTKLALILADVLQINCVNVQGGVLDNNQSLAGSDLRYSNGAPGIFSKAIIESPQFAQLCSIDEIDKIGTSGQDLILPAWLALLEKITAKSFRDNFFDVNFDTTGFSFIATANYIEQIPPELLSRFIVFYVDTPDKGQMVAVIKNIYAQLNLTRPYLSPKVSKAVSDKCALMVPRQVEGVLKAAIAKALRRSLDGKSASNLQNLRKSSVKIQLDDIQLKTLVCRRVMGFINSN